ncbi:sigma factor-like helix-turn-helix DNA-binding protein [Sphingobacterium spiritivorum]|uniref:sigma factor-like helix-turn-helix DNA-binding protein n=1 Tax=Sphingobacterium spiritivorum TaxID=258 RepID=UPI003DA21F14
MKQKLTDRQKKCIYKRWMTQGYTLYQLSQKYNTSQSNVSIIISKFLNKKSK